MTNTETTPTSAALAQVDNSPKAMVQRYQDSFAAVLPSQITRPETWIRIAQGALKKGKRLPDGRTELEVAAQNNVGIFLSQLLDAARMGLEPGTEQYYLTVRKVKGVPEILGIVGYQGYVELMYRAGYVSSVVVECVYTNDKFTYSPGRQEIPIHDIDWDAEDRGELRLVYAYAPMLSGGYSKVVVLNRQAIAKIRSKATGANSEHSPWNTNEDDMWLKSAARQLRKWVPTSNEDRRLIPERGAPIQASTTGPEIPGLPPVPSEFEGTDPDDEVVEGELVDEGAA